MFDKVRRSFREWRPASENLNCDVIAEFHFISESDRHDRVDFAINHAYRCENAREIFYL